MRKQRIFIRNTKTAAVVPTCVDSPPLDTVNQNTNLINPCEFFYNQEDNKLFIGRQDSLGNKSAELIFPAGGVSNDLKSNTVSGASFAGSPLTYTVVFITPYASTNYSITITGEVNRTFTWQTKTVNGFIINANSATAFAGNVDWITNIHT